MSQKKHKKRKPQTANGKKVVVDPLRDESRTKRLSPAARNMMLLGLIILAGGQMLFNYEMINQVTVNITSVVALILALSALYLQFNARKQGEKGLRR